MSPSPRTLRSSNKFSPKNVPGLALWLDASQTGDLYTTDAGPVVPVSAPTDIAGCALWLDAADATTISATSGAVDQWNDKSGNARHHTASSTARPITGTRTQNGLNVIDFDGANNFLTGNAASLSMLQNVPQAAVFLVMKFDALTANQYFFEHKSFGAGARFQIFAQPGGNLVVGGRRLNADSLATISSTATTNPAIIAGIADYANSDLFLRRDGTTLASSTSFQTDGLTENAASPGHTLGGVSGLLLDGFIAEVVVYNTALSAADRARVEAYLAQRWGITGVHANATAANDPVGYWRDRSGNGRHATQSTAASRPAVSATALNGRKQLGLVSQHLRGPAATWNGSASIYWVGKTGQSSSGAIVFHDGAAADQTDAFHAGWLNTQGVGAYGNGWGSGNTPRAESPSAWRNADIVAGVTLSSTESLSRVNGAQTSTVAALAGTLSQTVAGQFYVGREAAGTWANLNGTLSELLIYQPALNAIQRVRLERYLAAKWGITLAPQVANLDAQDWINRVYANGGTVTASTAAAVNQFCNDIDSAGLRSLMYRLNLFCGTGLNACLVPLYLGPAYGGTVYGNATDINTNFVSNDYFETGAANGGLQGNRLSTKRLNTGVAGSTFSGHNFHCASYEIVGSDSTYDSTLGAWTSTGNQGFYAGQDGSIGQWSLSLINNQINATTSPYAGHYIALQTAAATGAIYKNGALAASSFYSGLATSSDWSTVTWDIAVFAGQKNSAGTYGEYSSARLGGYSFGLAMNATQAAAYYTAMQKFQTALTRNV